MDVVIGGLVSGGLFALVAQSFVLTFLTTRTLNFAVGEFMALAAFIALALAGWGWLPGPLRIAVTVVVLGVLGAVVYRLLVVPFTAGGPHDVAAAAQDEGRFDAQIAPVTLEDGTVVGGDEGVRRGGTLETLAGLKAVFRPEGGVITAGNSSQISDGSAALLLTTSEKARELGLTPIVRVHTAVLAGTDPVIMLTAPIPATQKALRKSGLGTDDIGALEVNEAFAPVPLAWLADLGADPKALNPNGGAIAFGHPLGGSGARLTTTLVHHMRDNSIRYGLQTMCEGGGQANATIFELL